MTAVQLALSASGNLLQGFLFAFVGFAMARRLQRLDRVPGAAKAFVVWWYLMAFQGLLVAAMDIGTVAGWVGDVRSYQALYMLNILVASAQIWALGYYLIYLWTGKDRSPNLWLGLFATAYFVYFFLLVVFARPASVAVGTWSTGLELGLSGTQLAVLGVLFFLPIFALLGGYFLLAFELRGESQRLRVIVLGVVAALWNLSLVDRFATDAAEPAPFLGFIMVLNLVWIIVLYLVYFPPTWLRRRLTARRAPARTVEPAHAHATEEPSEADGSSSPSGEGGEGASTVARSG